MEDRGERLARTVAEAADAWLRDPLDAGVYRRLVDATLAWRAHTSGTGAADPHTSTPTSPVAAVTDAEPADPPDDARFLRPERAPQRLGGALDGVASLLRARAASAGGAGGADTGSAGDAAHDERTTDGEPGGTS
ncbi:hypothetical protein IF650_00035 [Cellulosimicrobium terreum]|nr:hypothetical protein [Cellulosimicrobium terreum]